MPSILPLEIKGTILDFLAKDHDALKLCSLVCQAFLPRCRKYLFESIVLDDYNLAISPTIHAFERLLHETPEIADYIRTLNFTIRIEDLTSPSIRESLERISKLKFLTLRFRDRDWPDRQLDWSYNPIRLALLHLLHLPTITHSS